MATPGAEDAAVVAVPSKSQVNSMTFRLLCLAFLCVFAPSFGVNAEVFISDVERSSILVYDNQSDGADLAPKREIRGDKTRIDDPIKIRTYSGTAPGSPTELFVCNLETGEITVFPVSGDGNIEPLRVLGTNGCYGFTVAQDQIYTAYAAGSMYVYDYRLEWDLAQEGRLAEPLRELVFGGEGELGVLDLEVDSGELFALVVDQRQNPAAFSIWIFDEFADGLAEDEVRAKITIDPDLKYTDIEVVGSEVLLSISDDQPLPINNLLPYTVLSVDRFTTGFTEPLRRLSVDGVVPFAMTSTQAELFILDIFSGYSVFDIRAGGTAEPAKIVSRVAAPFLEGAAGIAVTGEDAPGGAQFFMALEEPVEGARHSGVGNLRGWAVANDGIDRVEVYVDGVLYQDAPYGGSRGDVAGVFPDIDGSDQSGFSLAYNYNVLGSGEHRIEAVAYTKSGRAQVASATFEVTRPGQEFIADPNGVDLANSACTVTGQTMLVEDLSIDGDGPWDAVLRWQTASQSFEVQQYILGNDSI